MPNASDSSKALTPTPSAACTAACTGEPENANADALNITSLGTPPQAPNALDTGHQGESEGTAAIDQPDPLAAIAAAIGALSPTDRTRLAKMLLGE